MYAITVSDEETGDQVRLQRPQDWHEKGTVFVTVQCHTQAHPTNWNPFSNTQTLSVEVNLAELRKAVEMA